MFHTKHFMTFKFPLRFKTLQCLIWFIIIQIRICWVFQFNFKSQLILPQGQLAEQIGKYMWWVCKPSGLLESWKSNIYLDYFLYHEFLVFFSRRAFWQKYKGCILKRLGCFDFTTKQKIVCFPLLKWNLKKSFFEKIQASNQPFSCQKIASNCHLFHSFCSISSWK